MNPPWGEVLLARFGTPVRSERLASSPRSLVWRVELAGGPVVVKRITGGADAAARHARELTALRLAARTTPAVAPAVLAADPAERVLVLEHLAHQRPGPDWIVDYATALARLHATPVAAGELPGFAGPTSADVAAFLGLADALGATVPPDAPAELAALTRRLARAPGRALLHGDPCPPNDIHTTAGVRFVDFEQAAVGDGLTELAYLRIGFPTCWCVTAAPPALLARAEAAYHQAWRAATGTEPDGDLTDACAGWLLRGDALVERAHRESVDHLARVPVEDWAWGTGSARQRLIHRLGVVAGRTADRADLAAVHQLCRDLRDRMRTRWPTLGPLPAIRP